MPGVAEVSVHGGLTSLLVDSLRMWHWTSDRSGRVAATPSSPGSRADDLVRARLASRSLGLGDMIQRWPRHGPAVANSRRASSWSAMRGR